MGMHEGDEEVEILSADEELNLDEAMDEALGAVESLEEEQDPESDSESATTLEAEVVRLREQNLRALADLENYRKRVARERAEERRFAGQSLLRDVLDVKDNLVRALQSRGEAKDLKLGVEMTLRQLDQVLQSAGVTPIAATGELFDPSVHEAVERVEKDGVEAPTVVEEMQPGYRLHERLLRPARVVVAVPESESGESSEDQPEGGAED